MTFRRGTKIWLGVFALSLGLLAIDGPENRLGGWGLLAVMAAWLSGLILASRGSVTAFRRVRQRLTLRLAFSYFLIGIVPIPLLLLLLATASYLLAFQLIGGRVKREVIAMSQQPEPPTPAAHAVTVKDGHVARSPLPWLSAGTPVPWASRAGEPRFLLVGDGVWLAAGEAPGGNGQITLMPVDHAVVQHLADRTGYSVLAEQATESRSRRGVQIKVDSEVSGRDNPNPNPMEKERFVRPHGRPPPAGKGILDREAVLGIYMARPVAAFDGAKLSEDRIVAVIGRTSARALFEDVFSTWVPGTGRVVLVIMGVLAACLLFVYLVALAIAFVLVGTLARNVNRLNRAAEAVSRGDFSVRVNSRSRDQIGDLARAFDGMAASIQRLLIDTARKERLEGEIAIARTIQQKLLPPPEASLEGIRVLAHFESVAEIGGDYYDYFRMPDGRVAVVVGDVSGHGLPTGLLVAMAKAALSTLIESGLAGPPLFARLNELIHRSTDSRNYMTLAVLAYDARLREAELTNAGQLPPYRLTGGRVETLSLPSFPLGVSAANIFPSRRFPAEPGDRFLFATDGFIEALSPSGEPFGFERLEALLQIETGAPAEVLRERILSAIETYTQGRPADDDRTMAIITID